VTRQHLDKLLREGDITMQQLKRFYSAAWNFYIAAANYALYNLPLEDELLENAEFVYFPRRAEATISQITYFISQLGNSIWCVLLMLCIVPGAHRILWTREHVTPYTTNNMGEIQTWHPVLLCI